MQSTALCALLGWEIAGHHQGQPSKVKLSDGKLVNFPRGSWDRCRQDIVRAIEAAKVEGAAAASRNGHG